MHGRLLTRTRNRKWEWFSYGAVDDVFIRLGQVDNKVCAHSRHSQFITPKHLWQMSADTAGFSCMHATMRRVDARTHTLTLVVVRQDLVFCHL